MKITKAQIYAAIMWLPKTLSEALCHYPTTTAIFLVVWNAFGTSWATGIKVPVNLDSYGLGFLDFTIDARVWMTNFQYHTHFPTWGVALLTASLNMLVAYGNWRKSHPPALPPKV